MAELLSVWTALNQLESFEKIMKEYIKQPLKNTKNIQTPFPTPM